MEVFYDSHHDSSSSSLDRLFKWPRTGNEWRGDRDDTH